MVFAFGSHHIIAAVAEAQWRKDEQYAPIPQPPTIRKLKYYARTSSMIICESLIGQCLNIGPNDTLSKLQTALEDVRRHLLPRLPR